MATSSITVRPDAPEYSRYYRPMRVIAVRVDTVGSADGVIVTATLRRSDGYGTVSTKTTTITSLKANVAFDLSKDCFDSNGVYRAKQGVYTVHVTVNDGVVVGDSVPFDVMVMSVRELRERYLRGVNLFASNVIRPRQQPRVVTGVTITDAAPTQFRQLSVLAWVFANKTLSWEGATPVVVDVNSVGTQYLLPNKTGTSYIEVTVIGELLPAVDKSETIVMDYDAIEDEEIRGYLLNAYQEVESRLYVKLEPTDIDTEGPASTFYASATFTDEYVEPISYYRPEYARNWLVIKFPFPYIIGVSRIEGFFNASKAFVIPISDWIVKNKVAGEVEFVPKQGALMSWQFTGLPFFAYMFEMAHIPSFWHFRLTVGLEDLSQNTPSGASGTRVRDAIGRLAAMNVLTVAGQAAAPGLVSESTSRDGVSESRAYASGKGGRFSNVISQHQEYLFGQDGETGELKRLRQRLLGLYFVTL